LEADRDEKARSVVALSRDTLFENRDRRFASGCRFVFQALGRPAPSFFGDCPTLRQPTRNHRHVRFGQANKCHKKPQMQEKKAVARCFLTIVVAKAQFFGGPTGKNEQNVTPGSSPGRVKTLPWPKKAVTSRASFLALV
jgi:hypothetical protein